MKKSFAQAFLGFSFTGGHTQTWIGFVAVFTTVYISMGFLMDIEWLEVTEKICFYGSASCSAVSSKEARAITGVDTGSPQGFKGNHCCS